MREEELSQQAANSICACMHVCARSLGNRRRRTSECFCAYRRELLLTAMIINELQALTAITSKKLQPLNTHKTNKYPASGLAELSMYRHYPLVHPKQKDTAAHTLLYLSCRIRKYKQLLHIWLPECFPFQSAPPPFLLPSLCLSFSLPSLLLFKSLFLISTFLSSLPSAVLSHHSLSLCFRSLWGQKPCMKNEITSIRWPWQWCINPHQLGSDSSP